MKDFAKNSPQFASRGFGVTVNAERWNGRHAMFGMVAMVATAYLQGHGLIPDADKVLDIKQWGGLAQVGFGETITNERAIVMIAHVHVLMVSIFAAVAPFRFQDSLAKNIGYTPEAPAGLIPPFKTGLTPEAELINGRLAMLGIISITMVPAALPRPTPSARPPPPHPSMAKPCPPSRLPAINPCHRIEHRRLEAASGVVLTQTPPQSQRHP